MPTMAQPLSLEGVGPGFARALKELLEAHTVELQSRPLSARERAPYQLQPRSPSAPQRSPYLKGSGTAEVLVVGPMPTIKSDAGDDAVLAHSSIKTQMQPWLQHEDTEFLSNIGLRTHLKEEIAQDKRENGYKNLKQPFTSGSGDVNRTKSLNTASGDFDCESTFSPTHFEDKFRGVSQDAIPQDKLSRLISHVGFESSFAALIVLNTISIAFEAQYNGLEVAHELGLTELTASDRFPKTRQTLAVLEMCFGILFTLEVALKMVGLRTKFTASAWNLFDSFIVLTWIINQVLDLDFLMNPMLLRLCRLARLMRLMRLIKWIQAMDALHVLVTSIRHSLSILCWSSLILACMITLTSLVVNSFVSSFLEGSENTCSASEVNAACKSRREVFEYFGTFTKTAVSLFEATLGNFAPVMRVLTKHVDQAWGIFFVVYKLVCGFAVTSVITGVFLHETFKVANSDDDLMVIQKRRQKAQHLTKMQRLFAAADRSGTGALSYTDFKYLFNDPFIQTWLSAYELDVVDVKLLFRMIDDGDGRITASELVAGVSRLKGTARSIDIHTVLHDMSKMKQILCRLMETVHNDALAVHADASAVHADASAVHADASAVHHDAMNLGGIRESVEPSDDNSTEEVRYSL